MKIYFDTSFLVSLYTADANSHSAINAISASAGDRLVSTLGELEMVNAMQLRVFRKEITAAQSRLSWGNFAKDLQAGVFSLRPLPDHAFERAQSLSRQNTARSGTRTADLLHVAAALELEADVLYSFDLQQRKLAQVAGLNVN